MRVFLNCVFKKFNFLNIYTYSHQFWLQLCMNNNNKLKLCTIHFKSIVNRSHATRRQ